MPLSVLLNLSESPLDGRTDDPTLCVGIPTTKHDAARYSEPRGFIRETNIETFMIMILSRLLATEMRDERRRSCFIRGRCYCARPVDPNQVYMTMARVAIDALVI